MDECFHDDFSTGELGLFVPKDSKIPSYRMEFEGIIRGNSEEIRYIKQILPTSN